MSYILGGMIACFSTENGLWQTPANVSDNKTNFIYLKKGYLSLTPRIENYS